MCLAQTCVDFLAGSSAPASSKYGTIELPAGGIARPGPKSRRQFDNGG